MLERATVDADAPVLPFYSETANEIQPDMEFKKSLKPVRSVPIWSIRDNRKKRLVSKPIKVNVSSEDDVFYVENETLLLVGIGSTMNDAMKDFSKHLIHFYKYYKVMSDDELTDNARRLKKIYSTIFVRDND